VPWRSWRTERFKTASQLDDANRGGFTFEPAVGAHETVHELDFSSLYPNIIREYNVSRGPSAASVIQTGTTFPVWGTASVRKTATCLSSSAAYRRPGRHQSRDSVLLVDRVESEPYADMHADCIQELVTDKRLLRKGKRYLGA